MPRSPLAHVSAPPGRTPDARPSDRDAGQRAPLWTRHEVVEITGATPLAGPDDDWSADGVGYRPDETAPGDLVLVTTPRGWGSRFPDTAAEIPDLGRRGAAAILTEAPPPADSGAVSCPVLRVDDTRAVLDALAVAARERFIGRVVCIVGDRDRLRTKTVLTGLLAAHAALYASSRGYNRARGVAASLARTPACAANAVYDVSTRSAGSAAAATRLARPHVVVVTGVRPSSSRRATDAMTTVFAGLEPGGVVVVNGDLPHRDRLLLAAVEHGAVRALTFGRSPGCDVRLVTTDVGATRVVTAAGALPVRIPADDRAARTGALGAIATLEALGIDWMSAPDLADDGHGRPSA